MLQHVYCGSGLPSFVLDAASEDFMISRTGDLGAIDAKFDVAVSSAVPALDYIVVDTTVTAQVIVCQHSRSELAQRIPGPLSM
jgi:chromosome segregation ATPase